jgi:hypothetical protein
MFRQIDKYKKPIVKNINENVSIAVYFPERKASKKDLIIVIYNKKQNRFIDLFCDTILDISDIIYEYKTSKNLYYNK